MEFKTCRNCGESQSLDNFWRISKASERRRADCIPCVKNKQPYDPERSRDYYRRNREELLAYNAGRKDSKREKHLQRTYGISLEDYDRMFEEQMGRCMVCLDPPTEPYFVVDHDHETRQVRGLLHRQCNAALGQLRDDPEILNRAANYLRERCRG